MSQNDYILFYSGRCVHSKELLVILSRDPELDRKFIKVNVDNRGANIPKYIEKVPSAIIPHNGRASLFVGKSIFKWYEDVRGGGSNRPRQQQPSQMQQQQQQQQTASNSGGGGAATGDILDYDPLGMSGYSDSFSFIDNNNPIKKAFSFINENFANEGSGGGGNQRNNSASNSSGGSGGIMGWLGGGGGNDGQQTERESAKKKEMDSAYDRMMAMRKNDVPQAIMRMGGN